MVVSDLPPPFRVSRVAVRVRVSNVVFSCTFLLPRCDCFSRSMEQYSGVAVEFAISCSLNPGMDASAFNVNVQPSPVASVAREDEIIASPKLSPVAQFTTYRRASGFGAVFLSGSAAFGAALPAAAAATAAGLPGVCADRHAAVKTRMQWK